MSTAVISVRVRRELKEEADRLGVNLREVVEKALEEEIRRARRERLRRLMEEALGGMELGAEDWVRSLSELRLER